MSSDRVLNILATLSQGSGKPAVSAEIDFVSSFLKANNLPLPSNMQNDVLFVLSELIGSLSMSKKKISVLESELESALLNLDKQNLKM